jgi:drug/metabolite transporter (DMT)-like permease
VARSAGGPPILRLPTATQLAALSYLAVAVTAVVFLAWYAAMKRLGVDRAGLFNGLIPIASLAAVALTGTGTITPLQFPAALTVLAGVILGLGRTPQVPARTRTKRDDRRHAPESGGMNADPGPLALR